MTKPVPSQSRIRSAVEKVSSETGVPPRVIRSADQTRPVVRARWRVWRELRAAGFGYAPIGHAWPCNHSTVINAMNRMQKGA